MDIKEIHESMINGQNQQAFEQIIEYGREFFSDYVCYLFSNFSSAYCYDCLSKMVKLFAKRIKEEIYLTGGNYGQSQES